VNELLIFSILVFVLVHEDNTDTYIWVLCNQPVLFLHMIQLSVLVLVVNNNFTVFYRAADELQNEAKAHVLKHVNVVTLYAVIFEPQHYGIVLEFVPRGCLEEFICRYLVTYSNILCSCVIL